MEWSDKAMRWMEIIMYLVLFNSLWLLGVAVGVGILGFFPASFALFKIFNDEDLFEPQNRLLPIIKSYISYYLKFFVKANCIGAIYAVMGFVTYFNITLMKQEALMAAILLIPTLLFLLYIFVTAVLFSPVIIMGEGDIKSKIKVIITGPLLLPKTSIFTLGLMSISIIIAYLIPISMLLFLISATIFTMNKVTIYELYEKKVLIKTI